VAKRNYRYIWLPDDDIYADACTITRFFRTMEANQLMMAQVPVHAGVREGHTARVAAKQKGTASRVHGVHCLQAVLGMLQGVAPAESVPHLLNGTAAWSPLGTLADKKAAIFRALQMSVCTHNNPGIFWVHLYQQPDNAFRFVSFNEASKSGSAGSAKHWCWSGLQQATHPCSPAGSSQPQPRPGPPSMCPADYGASIPLRLFHVR